MTAIDIIKHRIENISDADIEFYISMAETRIRQYLHLASTVDLSDYVIAIADIAVLYWQLDKTTKTTASNVGYTSSSFQEGNVRESHDLKDSTNVIASYEKQIEDILKGLDDTDKSFMVHFL